MLAIVPVVAGIVLAPAPVLGVPPVARYRACGMVCVAADLQEGELYFIFRENANIVAGVIPGCRGEALLLISGIT
jgi:hypothetical protein